MNAAIPPNYPKLHRESRLFGDTSLDLGIHAFQVIRVNAVGECEVRSSKFAGSEAPQFLVPSRPCDAAIRYIPVKCADTSRVERHSKPRLTLEQSFLRTFALRDVGRGTKDVHLLADLRKIEIDEHCSLVARLYAEVDLVVANGSFFVETLEKACPNIFRVQAKLDGSTTGRLFMRVTEDLDELVVYAGDPAVSRTGQGRGKSRFFEGDAESCLPGTHGVFRQFSLSNIFTKNNDAARLIVGILPWPHLPTQPPLRTVRAIEYIFIFLNDFAAQRSTVNLLPFVGHLGEHIIVRSAYRR